MASSIQNYVEKSKQDQNAQSLQILDAAASVAMGALISRGWEEPRALWGGLAMRVVARRAEDAGRNMRSAMSLRTKLMAMLESLDTGIGAEMSTLLDNEHVSIAQPYKKCMEQYHWALKASHSGAETLETYVRTEYSLTEMEFLATVIEKLRENTVSIRSTYGNLMHALDRDTDQEEQEKRANKWCDFTKDWPKIADLNYLIHRRALQEQQTNV
ncbi:hypothetical protein EV421DRAFT_1735603 [Armillaria borealis]|uniref:Uncharacterized protein n=1 Tax=Armillaria borealis TaxID=47425 RepID=A0AA39MRT4_9AGAR|nr:hypothetical protein EV421DRAFT_1735603 [Armillaria borealis]